MQVEPFAQVSSFAARDLQSTCVECKSNGCWAGECRQQAGRPVTDAPRFCRLLAASEDCRRPFLRRRAAVGGDSGGSVFAAPSARRFANLHMHASCFRSLHKDHKHRAHNGHLHRNHHRSLGSGQRFRMVLGSPRECHHKEYMLQGHHDQCTALWTRLGLGGVSSRALGGRPRFFCKAPGSALLTGAAGGLFGRGRGRVL